MPTLLSFRDLYAAWQAGVILPGEVPPLVTDLLASGVKSAALEDISWMRDPVSADLMPAFFRAALELRELPPSPAASRWRAAYLTAEEIASARITPSRGVEILHRLCTELDMPDALTSFIYNDCDDGLGPGGRAVEEAWFDQQIVSAAGELLRERPADSK